jgi:uncharacterized membrane protein
MRKARQRTTMTETTFPILFFFGLAGFWFFVAWRTAQTRMKTIPSDRTVSSQAILLGVQTIVFTLLITKVSQADRIRISNEIGLPLLFGVPALMITGVSILMRLLGERSS